LLITGHFHDCYHAQKLAFSGIYDPVGHCEYWVKYGGNNRTFTSADDWELVRVNVVVPNNDNFVRYMWEVYCLVSGDEGYSANDFIQNWLTLSPEEKNTLAAEFLISRDRAGWAEEFIGKEEEI
jgi:hypothetical protein